MKRMVGGSLRTRLLLMVMVAVLPALGLIFASTAWQARQEIKRIQEDAFQRSRQAAAELARDIEGARQMLFLLAHLREVRGATFATNQCESILQDLLDQYRGQYLNFGLIETNGLVSASALSVTGRVDLADRAYFQRALATASFVFGDFQEGRITGARTINFAYPVLTSPKRIQRVLFAALDLEWLNRELQQRPLPPEAVLTVLDGAGTVLARQPAAADLLYQPLADGELLATILKTNEGVRNTQTADGQKWLNAFSRLGDAAGVLYVVVSIPERQALQPVLANRNRNLLLLGMVTVAALAAAWYVGGAFIVQPVRALREATRRLADGDLTAQADVHSGAGEIGELAQAFNQMARSLQERVAERVRAADALRQSGQRLALHFYQTPLGVIEWDLDFRVTRWNPAAERIFGYTEAEALGQHAAFIVPASVRPMVDQVWQDLLARQGGQRSTNDNVTKDGRTIVCEWYNTPLVDANGNVVGAASQVEDITDRVRAEREIRRWNEVLEQRVRDRTRELEIANKELESFSYSVSHDLRAPLRVIDGFSHALLEDCGRQLTPEGQAHLQRIRAATRRMTRLIDDLLKLSRLTRAEIKKVDVDLSGLARQIIEELRQTEPNRAVTVVIADGIRGWGDATLIRAVLENLLGNAWKFTSQTADARIEFGKTTGGAESLAYFVRDNGAGFDMACVDKLFGAFQRLHTQSEFPGEGIGLATVQRIIRRHGGQVWATGAVKQGATFFFTLPNEP